MDEELANKVITYLVAKDLFFWGRAREKRYEFGLEAYNPEFVYTQFKLEQAIPELAYGSMNKGSSWRKRI